MWLDEYLECMKTKKQGHAILTWSHLNWETPPSPKKPVWFRAVDNPLGAGAGNLSEEIVLPPAKKAGSVACISHDGSMGQGYIYLGENPKKQPPSRSLT